MIHPRTGFILEPGLDSKAESELELDLEESIKEAELALESKKEAELAFKLKKKSHGFYVGADIGQAVDPSALCVVEHVSDGSHDEFHVRYCQRLPLNTPYAVVVSATKQVVDQLLAQTHRVYLGVDATSVGRPVTELMEKVKLKPTKITVTSGNTSNFDGKTGFWHVSKTELVTGGQLALGRGQLKIGEEIEHMQILIDELTWYTVKPNIATGNTVYEAHRERDHDDLTFSMLICIWMANREAKRLHALNTYKMVAVSSEDIETAPQYHSAFEGRELTRLPRY
jgi:hypothetical protein